MVVKGIAISRFEGFYPLAVCTSNMCKYTTQCPSFRHPFRFMPAAVFCYLPR